MSNAGTVAAGHGGCDDFLQRKALLQSKPGTFRLHRQQRVQHRLPFHQAIQSSAKVSGGPAWHVIKGMYFNTGGL